MTTRKGYTLIEMITTMGGIGIAVGSLALACGLVYVGYKGVQALDRYANSPAIRVERSNVIEGEKAEEFIELNNKKFYSEIDGKSVEDYLKDKK
jgi:hypothetical protein